MINKSKFFSCVMICLFSAACLFGCSSYVLQNDSFYAGETVTPDQIEIIDGSLSHSGAQQIEIKPTTLCYWTSGGSKFHLFEDCQSLSRTDSSKIETGIYDYIKDKKECCSYCMKNAVSNE